MRENSSICCKFVSAVVFSKPHLRAMLAFGVVSGVVGGLSIDAFAAPTFFPFRINSKGAINMSDGVAVTRTDTGNGLCCPFLDTPAAGVGPLENRTDAPPFGNPGGGDPIPAFNRGDLYRWNADVRPPYANGNPDFNFGAGFDNSRGQNGRVGRIPAPGQPTASVVPAPGAILLGSIGTCLVGWLRRRKSL